MRGVVQWGRLSRYVEDVPFRLKMAPGLYNLRVYLLGADAKGDTHDKPDGKPGMTWQSTVLQRNKVL
jgi:hypothetical protein